MNTYHVDTRDKTDKRYLARCLSQLKSWGAPTDGWYCTEVIDVREDDPEAPLSECELCGCKDVRYEHIMQHDYYFEPVTVGCICAGIMEGSILRARERERMLRNRSRRRKNFIKRRWVRSDRNICYRRYRNQDIYIFEGTRNYTVKVGWYGTSTYKGRPINNFLSAVYAAFDLAGPKAEIL